MPTIQTQFGQQTYIPDISDLNAGLSLGSGDDFLSPRTINNVSSGFTRTISPIDSYDPYGYLATNGLRHNATPAEILFEVTGVSRSVRPVNSNSPVNLVGVPNLPFPYYQPVPDLGVNPSPALILSASTQFQNQLVTEGAPAIPGYPAIDFGPYPEALDFLGGTTSFISSMMPHHPSYGLPVVFPGNGGYGQYYPPFPIMPSYPGGSGFYPHFAPYHGKGVIPSQIPYPTPQPPFCVMPPVVPPCPPFPGFPPQQPELPSTTTLLSVIYNNPFKLPDFIPTNTVGGVLNFIQQFNNASESKRTQIRQELANPTSVNMAILNSTGITSTGGRYGQGKVTNPFKKAGFLTDTNPYERFNSGMVVTNGNDNGKVKGTPVTDIIFGTLDRNNIIDGKGGEDNIVGSSKKDLVNAHAGDRVFTGQGDDLIFFDFTETSPTNCRLTVIDASEGKDTLVLTVAGNPSKDEGTPSFTRLSDGSVSVSIGGKQILTRGIEKYIVVDKDGHIGGVYKPTTTQQ